jgi:hypothetical protein
MRGVFSIVVLIVAWLQPVPALPLKIDVPATLAWVDTKLTVSKGQRLIFKAEGVIAWGRGPGETAGPQGSATKPGKLGKGGLIGRVGYYGKPFPIGASVEPMAMPKSGALFLGINDFILRDNHGTFVVTIDAATR